MSNYTVSNQNWLVATLTVQKRSFLSKIIRTLSIARIAAIVPKNIKLEHKTILEDQKVKLPDIPDTLRISKGNLSTILHQHFCMVKVYAKWMPRLRTFNQKQQRVEIVWANIGLFYALCDNAWIVESLLYSKEKSAIIRVDSNFRKGTKSTKKTKVDWKVILECA